MSADKLVWNTVGALLLVATRALCAWLRMEPRLLGEEDEVARLRRLGAV